MEARRRRIEAGKHYRKEIDESKPDEGDTMGWMEAYVRERDKKHSEEREILLNILQVMCDILEVMCEILQLMCGILHVISEIPQVM